MPQLIAGALISYGWSTLAAWVVSYAITYGAYYAYGTYQARQARNAARDSFNASLKDRLVMTATTDAPRSRVYGRQRNVDGIVFKSTHGTHKEFYTLVISTAGHEIDAFEAVYFNDTRLTLDGSGYVQDAPYAITSRETVGDSVTLTTPTTSGSFTLAHTPIAGTVFVTQEVGLAPAAEDRTTITFGTTAGTTMSVVGNVVSFTGADTTVSPVGVVNVSYQYTKVASKARVRGFLGGPSQDLSGTLIATGVSGVTSAHKFAGFACLLVTLEFDTDAFPQGIPSVSAVMRGAKVFDPRTGLTVWTQNPALIARDWALYAYGGGADASELYDNLANEANVCDVTHAFVDSVHGTTVRPIYTCNMVASTQADPDQILNEIVASMAGKKAWVGGRLRIKAGSYRAPVTTIFEDWLTDKQEIDIAAGIQRNDLVNAYRPSIADDRQNYITMPTQPIIAAAYVALDGEELSREVTFAAITDTDHAQHVAGVLLRDARQSLTVTLPCNMRAYPIEVFDTVAVTIPRFGWSAKVFEVLATEFSPTKGVLLTMKETDASIFDPDALFTTADASPNTNLPLPWTTEEVLGLAVASGTAPLSDGSLITRTLVAWTPIVSEAIRQSGEVEVQYWRASDPLPSGDWMRAPPVSGNADATVIVGLQTNTGYLFRARTKSSIGVRSKWSKQVLHVVADLPDFTGLDWTSLPGRPLFFRAVARGGFDTSSPVAAGLYDENGVAIGGYIRSYMLVRIRRSDGAVMLARGYDVYGSTSAFLLADLVNDLNASGPDSIVVVYTYDEPRTNRLSGGLEQAMYRCGASPAVFGKPNFAASSAYVLVGIGGCGEGNGFESYSGGASLTNRFCDVSFMLRAGNFIVTGAAATPGTLADYGYIGTLDATTDLTLFVSGNCVVAGNYVSKLGGANAWDSDARSRDAAFGACMCSAAPAQTNAHLMFGINSDPALDSSYFSLDYAWYCVGDTSLRIYESGVDLGSVGVYATTDVLSIVYDGSTVRYFKNGTLIRAVSTTANRVFFFDSSFQTPGGALRTIRFGALSANDWQSIGGVGKAADNATVGAIIGTNLSGQINAGNAPTFLTPGSIGSAVSVGTTSGGRVETGTNVIRIYDAANVLRVKLGDLS